MLPNHLPGRATPHLGPGVLPHLPTTLFRSGISAPAPPPLLPFVWDDSTPLRTHHGNLTWLVGGD